MSTRTCLAVALVAALTFLAPRARAQLVPAPTWPGRPLGAVADSVDAPALPGTLRGATAESWAVAPLLESRLRQAQATTSHSWWAPAASAVLPGAGQWMLDQDRAIGYLAAEAYGWLRFAADLREARRQRSEYRRIAATVARAVFSVQRPPGNFEYYERMENFVESGIFDADAADGVQPETDSETFNGELWLRARATFWEDPASPPHPATPAYLDAVEYYAERAIRPEFRWSWRDAQLEQDLFRRTIDRSNDAYRRSLQDLGVILANHVLSTVDAYVTLRIQRMGGSSEQVGMMGSIPWSPDRGVRRGGDPRRRPSGGRQSGSLP